MTNYEKKIIELALQGYSTRKIADSLSDFSEHSINDLIKSLNDINSPNYNPKIYSNILMERSLRLNNFIDKDLIFKVKTMILDGYLPIEIAVLNNLTLSEYEKVIYNIKHLTYFDEEMLNKIKTKLHEANNIKTINKYRRILKLEKQFPNLKLEDYGFEIVNYRRWQENFKLVNDFLENNLDLAILAMKYNIAKTSVRNLLTNSDAYHFLENNFDLETKERVIKQYYAKINEEPKKLDITFKKVEPKIESITNNGRFWILFLLTFRLPISALAKMFKIKDEKQLHESLFYKAEDLNGIYPRALYYLDCNSDFTNLEKAINFYKEYMDAKKNNLPKAKEMIKLIDERDFFTLIKSNKKIDKMTKEEHRLIADNWVKFALSSRDFPYQLSSLNKYCLPYHEEEINKIKSFNLETSRLSQRMAFKRNNRGY